MFLSKALIRHSAVINRVFVVVTTIGIGLLIGHASASGSPLILFLAVLPVLVLFVLKPYLQIYALAILSVWWTPVLSVAGLNVTACDLMLAVTWLSTTSTFMLITQTRCRGGTYVNGLVVGLVTLGIIGGIMGNIGAALSGGFEVFLKGVALYLKRWGEYSVIPLSAMLFLDSRHARTVWKAMLLIGITVAFLGMVLPGYLGRATSVVFNPNVFGLLCVIVSNMAVACVLFGMDTKLGMLALVAGTLGIVVSASRSAGVAYAVSALYWMWVFQGRLLRWKYTRRIILLALLILVGLSFAGDFVQIAVDRWRGLFVQGVASASAAARFDAWQVSLRMIIDRPLFGYGIGQVPAYGTRYVSEYARIIRSTVSTSDNQFIDILLESGIVGVFFATLTFRALWRIAAPKGNQAKQVNDRASMAGHSLRSVLVAFLTAGITVPSFSSPFTSAWIWLLAGILAAERRFAEMVSLPGSLATRNDVGRPER